jgi:hypothetical protein
MDYQELICQARGTDRHGTPVEIPVAHRAAAARRLVEDGFVSVEQLNGLPLDDLFNLVGHRQRERDDCDRTAGELLHHERSPGHHS